MGIIIKQSIKGSIWSYLGVGLGFITTAYLFPNYLSPDTVGLFGLLIAWSSLLAQFSLLGFNGVTARLFPYFRDRKKGHNGFLFLGSLVMLSGFILFLLAFWILSPWLMESNTENSQLFSEYIDLLVPLTFFAMLFSFLDVFNKLLYNAVFGTFLTEFVQRLLILGAVLSFIMGWLNLHQLVLAYAGAVSAKGLFMFFYLLFSGELDLKPRWGFIDKKLKKEIINVALFSILTGIGGSIVFRIDKIIVNQLLGLSATGIYTIAFYFGTLVVMPSRPLLRISGTLIADAWKRNDTKYISELYHKSCLNQFIIAAFLFGGIWINIDNIITILGPAYAGGKWVIFFIGLGYVIDMTTGANGQIITFSKYYRMGLWFLVILIMLSIATMFLLIPVWGITGAAVAIALSFFVNNLMRFLFLKLKFGMQPFTYHFLIVLFLTLSAFFIITLIPQMNVYKDILIRSALFIFFYVAGLYFFPISADVDRLLKEIIRKTKKLFCRRNSNSHQ